MLTLSDRNSVWMIEPRSLADVAKVFSVHKIEDTKVDPMSLTTIGEIEKEYGVARMHGSCCVVSVNGVMLRSAPGWAVRYGMASSTTLLRRTLEIAASDENVRSVVMLINSPGGSVSGLHKLGVTAAATAARKPMTAVSNGMVASAAYYLAAFAHSIVADVGDMVGSIGSIIAGYDMSKMAEKEGIEPVVISTGEMKHTFMPGTEVTDAQKQMLQNLVDAAFADFKRVVVAGRRMSDTQFATVADASIFESGRARELGLVDEIGNIDDILLRNERANVESQRAAENRNRVRRAEIGLRECV